MKCTFGLQAGEVLTGVVRVFEARDGLENLGGKQEDETNFPFQAVFSQEAAAESESSGILTDSG